MPDTPQNPDDKKARIAALFIGYLLTTVAAWVAFGGLALAVGVGVAGLWFVYLAFWGR